MQQPVQLPDPHKAEKRRLARLLDGTDGKLSRLLDAYTDGAPGLDRAEYRRRYESIEQQAAAARTRLADLDDQPTQAPTAATVAGFSATWSTLSVDARRDVTAALVTAVRVHPDKSVVLLPRWGEPVTVTFTKRGTVPVLLTSSPKK